jgi:hypothetical protein
VKQLFSVILCLRNVFRRVRCLEESRVPKPECSTNPLDAFWIHFGFLFWEKNMLFFMCFLIAFLDAFTLRERSLASQTSPKDTILVSFWTPDLESSGPEDQWPGTGDWCLGSYTPWTVPGEFYILLSACALHENHVSNVYLIPYVVYHYCALYTKMFTLLFGCTIESFCSNSSDPKADDEDAIRIVDACLAPVRIASSCHSQSHALTDHPSKWHSTSQLP